jgi:formate hydrogenlyase transcriptional activator
MAMQARRGGLSDSGGDGFGAAGADRGTIMDKHDLLQVSRYKALLGVSTAITQQNDLNDLLHSISVLLSKVVPFDTISLLLCDQEARTAQLYALDFSFFDEHIALGIQVPYQGTRIEEALEQQRPVFVVNTPEEMARIPEFEGRQRIARLQSLYIFPVTSSRKQLGAMIFGAGDRQFYSDADIELMSAVVAHVTAALETALAREVAESYRVDLERERDRLNLLLEINNHIITHLDVNDLFQAASASIRGFFKVAFCGFWLLEEGVSQLQCVTMDFPGGSGQLDRVPSPLLSEEEMNQLRMRVPKLLRKQDLNALPCFISESLRSESIATIFSAPLMGSSMLLGMVSLGSRQEDAFSQSDQDLIRQVANQISLALENAVAYRRLNIAHEKLEEERLYLESEIQSAYNFEDIIGNSPALRRVLDQISIVAPTDATVLLVGETGTGKELIARAIHNRSSRSERTFVRMNCAAIPQGLLESELFGHEKGAFTGAIAQKRGRMELADEGTLFLDEIGDIDLSLQPKLLRVLQEREFERLGSNRTTRVNIRLIAATNRDLMEMVGKGDFREDLYYRLNVFPVVIPPLRQRREDIPLLVNYFVDMIARRMRKSIRSIPAETMRAMLDWSWPGNVRELQNFVERSVILTRGESLMAPVSELHGREKPLPQSSRLPSTSREAILEALRAAHGRLAGAGGAAERLGLKRTTLLKRMAKLEISRQEFEEQG